MLECEAIPGFRRLVVYLTDVLELKVVGGLANDCELPGVGVLQMIDM